MTKSKKEKIAEKILKHLKGTLTKDELSKDKGYRVPTTSPISKKVRRHSGRKQASLFGKDRIAFQEGIEQIEYYDEWTNYRDNFRDRGDRTKLIKEKGKYTEEGVKEANKKIKKQIQIRKLKKLKKNERIYIL